MQEEKQNNTNTVHGMILKLSDSRGSDISILFIYLLIDFSILTFIVKDVSANVAYIVVQFTAILKLLNVSSCGTVSFCLSV